MSLSQGTIFLLAFLFVGILVVVVKKNRNLDQNVVVYSIGFKEFEEEHGEDNEHEVSGLLHVSQVLQKADRSGNITMVRNLLERFSLFID